MALTSGLGGQLSIDLGALARNWRALDKVSAGALTAAVVKADAYGTGIEQASKALHAAGARFFFVATPDEGMAVRAAVPDAHIFILYGLYPGAANLYIRQNLMPVLSSMSMLEEWMAKCIERNEAYPAAFHFDTGINRLGFRLNEASLVRESIEKLGYAPQMVMSHLACADTPNHEKNRTQLALFGSVMSQFPGIPASLSNSAGLMTGRDYHFQMVRPGIALYGGRAVGGRKNPMQPVVTLHVPILQVTEGRTGESVGYGATYTLNRNSKLAILGYGYADGFLRALSGTNPRPGGKVFIRGKLCPVIGRISMDLTVVDVTELGSDLPTPGEGAEVLGANVSIDDQADAAGTIGYEILTSLKGRYSRNYVGDGNLPE
ncbi:alanine racemase [Devosia subaequoris]|uniref:Alanine racemase n=1 Tax=Devosia subaequoris TaxID=395930 RepID=A0A7W6IKY7_9HYPH|nr:alanine racemase [Devosia subaequoris]MBB4050890.1 alanine racemase [Devosia subaequoris]MCP1208435.1 alanine racemase [Devosia subaequoris]